MRATVSHFEIPARDLDRAARFYQEVFAWRIDPVPWTTPYYKVRGAAMLPRATAGQGVPAPTAAVERGKGL